MTLPTTSKQKSARIDWGYFNRRGPLTVNLAVIEHYDADAAAKMVMADVHARLAEKGGTYGLVRHDGFLMHFPGKNQMLANVTHF